MEPIIAKETSKKTSPPKGRAADRAAFWLASLAAGLALICAVIIFAGFLENDSYFGAVVSAFSFTAGLSLFAIIPPAITARIAQRAYKNGGTKRGAAWALLLMLPWLILSALLITHTPLPIWISTIALTLSALLTAWAAVCLFIEPSKTP